MGERIQAYLAALKRIETLRNGYMEKISETLKPSMINSNLDGSEFRNIRLEGLFKMLLAHLVNHGDSFSTVDKNSPVGSKFLRDYRAICMKEGIEPELFIKENDAAFELTVYARITLVKLMKVKSTDLAGLASALDEMKGADGHGLDEKFDKVVELAQKHNSAVYFLKNGENPWGSPYYNTYIVVGNGSKSKVFFAGYDSGNYDPFIRSYAEEFKKNGLLTQGEIGERTHRPQSLPGGPNIGG